MSCVEDIEVRCIGSLTALGEPYFEGNGGSLPRCPHITQNLDVVIRYTELFPSVVCEKTENPIMHNPRRELERNPPHL